MNVDYAKIYIDSEISPIQQKLTEEFKIPQGHMDLISKSVMKNNTIQMELILLLNITLCCKIHLQMDKYIKILSELDCIVLKDVYEGLYERYKSNSVDTDLCYELTMESFLRNKDKILDKIKQEFN